MVKKFQTFIAAAVVAVGLGAVLVAPVSYAACTTPAGCVGSGVDEVSGGGSTAEVGDIIKLIVDVLLYIIAAVSVVMIVIGGFRYVVSQGDSSAVTSAKNTILYAVIGLLVAIFAYAIVHFVISQFV